MQRPEGGPPREVGGGAVSAETRAGSVLQQGRRHRAVREGLPRVQAGRGRLRPQVRRHAGGDHLCDGARSGGPHADRKPASHAPAHLEVAGAALVVGGVEDEPVPGHRQLGHPAQGEGPEDPPPPVCRVGGGVDGPDRPHLPAGVVEERPAQEGPIADHTARRARPPTRATPRRRSPGASSGRTPRWGPRRATRARPGAGRARTARPRAGPSGTRGRGEGLARSRPSPDRARTGA